MPTNFTVVPVEDSIEIAEEDADEALELSGRQGSGEECHVGIHTHSFPGLAQAR